MTRGRYRVKPLPGSVAELIGLFRQSPRYRGWAPNTRKHADRVLDDFRVQNGRAMIADLSFEDIVRLRDGMAATPGAANNWVKVIRALLWYAKRIGYIRNSPLAEGLETLPPNRPGGFRTWRDDEITQFRAHYPIGSTPRLVLELALGTAAAPVDLVKLGWMNVQRDTGGAGRGLHHGGCDPASGGSRDHHALARIRYRRQKTERRKGTEETPLVDIPISPQLAEVLAHAPLDRLTFLETIRGTVRQPNILEHQWRRWVDDAGLDAPDARGRRLTLHGLRKAVGRRLAEAGASPNIIMAVLGHETVSAGQAYTAAYDRAREADMGAELLEGAKPSNVTRLKKP
jgi:integrase